MKIVMRRLSFKALLLVGAALLFAQAAFAQGQLKWIQGFPQRIGASVMLMWEPLPGAAKYIISRSAEGKGQPFTRESAINNFVDDKALATETYTYQILALDDQNKQLSSSTPAVLKGAVPLDIPRIDGHHQDGPRLLISWQGDPRTVFFNLYKALQGKQPKLLAAVSATKYVDVDTKPDEVYEYFLRGVDQAGVETKDSAHVTIKVESWKAAAAETFQHREVEVTRFKLSPEVRLGEPTDLVLRNGLIYLTDSGSRSVMALTMDGKLFRRFGQKPPDYNGVWGIPWGISADAFGRRFAVTFLQSPNVRVFDDQGVMILDMLITPPPELTPDQYLPNPPQPMDVAIEDQEGYWLTEYTYGQVVYMNLRGKEEGRVGTPRVLKNSGPFKSPTFLMIHPGSGYINVVDSLQGKVFRVFNDGKVAGSWGNDMEGEGSLHLPKGIDADENGELLVVDGMLSTLQAFSQAGKLLAVFVARPDEKQQLPAGMISVAVERGSGDIYVLSKVENAVFRLRLHK